MNLTPSMIERNRQIILRLKELKLKRNLTNGQIEELTIKKGTAVSLSTIKRVFAEGSEDRAESFNYNLTLRPLIIALEDLPEDPVSIITAVTEQEKQIATLQNIIQIKNIELDTLANEVEGLKQQIVKVEADSQKKVDFLKDQIDFKEGQMEEKDRQIKEKDKQLGERANYLLLKDAEIKDLKAEAQGYKKANKWLIAFVFIALFLAAVLPPIVPLL